MKNSQNVWTNSFVAFFIHDFVIFLFVDATYDASFFLLLFFSEPKIFLSVGFCSTLSCDRELVI
jgi:hypothetical protein